MRGWGVRDGTNGLKLCCLIPNAEFSDSWNEWVISEAKGLGLSIEFILGRNV